LKVSTIKRRSLKYFEQQTTILQTAELYMGVSIF